MTVAHRVRVFWDETDAGVRPAVSSEELAAFEASHDCVLPASVAGFYLTANGMMMDGELFVAWPLAEVGPVPITVAPFHRIPNYGTIVDTLPDAKDYFAFGDCMMWSQVFAVRILPAEAGTPVLWISGDTFIQVANSFDEFWETYLRDPWSVLWALSAK